MLNRIFVDTLFVIALVNRRDQYHQQAIEASKQCEGSPFLITDVVLLEIGNALARRYRKEAVEILEEFLHADDVDIVHLTPSLFDKAFDLYKQHQDKEWGLIDCVSFVVMREQSITHALTFDRHFAQAGFHVLMREIA
jgi:predicted nucleic acid-binding protein